MPKRKSTTSAAGAGAEDYDSDGGFVEDAPRSKKVKGVKNGGEKGEGGGGGGVKDVKEKEKKGGGKGEGIVVGGGGQVGKDGEEFWEVRRGVFCFV